MDESIRYKRAVMKDNDAEPIKKEVIIDAKDGMVYVNTHYSVDELKERGWKFTMIL